MTPACSKQPYITTPRQPQLQQNVDTDIFIVKHILSEANIWPEKCDQETFYSRHSCLSPDTSHAAVV